MKVLACCVAAVPLVYFLLNRHQWLMSVLIGLSVFVVAMLLKVAHSKERVQRDRIYALLILLFANTLSRSRPPGAADHLPVCRPEIPVTRVPIQFSTR